MIFQAKNIPLVSFYVFLCVLCNEFKRLGRLVVSSANKALEKAKESTLWRWGRAVM